MSNTISRSRLFSRVALLCALGGGLVSVPVASIAASKTLSIYGSPNTTVAVMGYYSFQPTAKDTVKSRIKFDIYNKPVWATFNGTTGQLTGQPARNQVGTYSNITIRLTDWYGYVTTAPFSITVLAPTVATGPVKTPPPVVKTPVVPTPPVTTTADGVATLDWLPPTENTDGSALTNLAGYKVYYGTSPTNLSHSIEVTNPGLTAYTVTSLSSGTWYFAVVSYSTAGVVSRRTGTVSTTI